MLRTILTQRISVLALLLAFPAASLARTNNPPAGMTGSMASMGNTCMNCHSNTSGSGSVQVLNAPANYQLNMIYDLVVRVADPVQVGAGFQLSVEDSVGVHVGTISVTDATNTELNLSDANYINHTPAGVGQSVTDWASLSSGAEFQARWQAPASDVGPITFWASGNAMDNAGANTGDIIYLSSLTANGPAVVPAVSEWGVLVMTLLVLTVGTIVLGTRRPELA